VEEGRVVGSRSVHAGDKSKLGHPADEVPGVERGGDEPRGDALHRVEEEVNATQLRRVAKMNTPAAQQNWCYVSMGTGYDRRYEDGN
jgi:hypothetical protein